MRRSEINAYIREAESLFDRYCFKLPQWASWGPSDWQCKGLECDEIRKCGLGWDITDFGSGDFLKCGLLLITLRNGVPGDSKYKKTYAEKIMVVREMQVTPMHFHWHKMEDIINRGGGDLVMQLWKASFKEELSDEKFSVSMDGVEKNLAPGETIRLKPGESIALEPYVYHKFWAENGIVMAGEVSMVNDDKNDNRFYLPAGRFPKIDEDEAPLRLLCNEYPNT